MPECGALQEVDRKAIEEFKDVKDKMEALLDVFKFREAQKEAMNLARIGNKYITECEPWKVWKTDPKRVETILYISLQLVANLSIAFEPFLPFSSKKLRDMIGLARLRLVTARQHQSAHRWPSAQRAPVALREDRRQCHTGSARQVGCHKARQRGCYL